MLLCIQLHHLGLRLNKSWNPSPSQKSPREDVWTGLGPSNDGFVEPDSVLDVLFC